MSLRTFFRHAVLLACVACVVSAARAQLTPDQQADMLLASAKKAFNEGNHPFAVQRFREFVGKFGNHKELATARFGLALALLEGPEKDRNFGELQPILQQLAGDKAFPDQAAAAYYLALSFRGQGMAELQQADLKPAEAQQRRATAQQRFEQAIPAFAQALTLFQATAGPAGDKELPASWEWVARARADLAEMQLRAGKTKEAQATAEPFGKDATLVRSKYQGLGKYLYAHAAFLQGDASTAQKTLVTLAPFASPEFGSHARYVLARTHHLADERAEAAVHYDGAVNDHKKVVADALQMLKEPQRFNNDPRKRAELETIVKAPTPDHVARANFYLGALLYEAGRFAEAKVRFAEFVKAHPASPLRTDAELRIGYCQVQGKEWADAIKTLQPLVEKDAKLADQTLLWLGKAQAGAAPDAATKPNEFKVAVQNAIGTLNQAFARAQQLGDGPEAKARRGDIALEIADQFQAIAEHRQAATKYESILAEKTLPEREEEVAVRAIQAWHLARDHAESDKRCVAFTQKFPKSTLLPVVAFVYAENAYFRAAATEKTPPSPERAKALATQYDETIKRTQEVIAKYPEYPKILLVRHALGLTYYRQGDLEKAYKAWSDIPATERAGELAAVPFLMADCILRQTPTAVPDDALAAGKLEEQLKTSSELLDAYVSGNPKDASAPDAMIKLGLCQQRLAGLLAQPEDKKKSLQAARAVYEKLLSKDYANHPLQAQALYERAKVLLAQGDTGNGTNELRRFTTEPMRQAKIAPMACLNLATVLRAQQRSVDAADLLQKTREAHEGALSGDPQRVAWVPLLRFHHAAALRESGKVPQARELFLQTAQQFPKTPEGIESTLRAGQCLREEAAQTLDAARKLAQNPKDAAQADAMRADGYRRMKDASVQLEATAEKFKTLDGMTDVRARMLYEAAWCARVAAEPEVAAARLVVAKSLVKKLGAGAEKLPLPNVPLDQVPVQPTETKARALYKALIAAHGDAALSLEARFELAELLADRNEVDPALALLNEAMDKEPAADLTEKIRLRIGAIHAAKGNLKGALAQFEAVAQNPKSQNLGWAHYRAAEVHLANKDYGEAVKRLVIFRDNGQFQNVPGLTDRALLRLGHAYAMVKGWGESAQAMERLVGAFPNSPWSDDGRFGLGWALQQQNNLDGAVNWYSQVVGRTATELAAKAQYQIGVCRLTQKRYVDAANAFLVVPTTYDYPELAAASLLEAARAYHENNQKDQSARLLERVLRDYPGTPFADVAKERLEKN